MRKSDRVGKLCLAAAVTVLLLLSLCLSAFAAAPDLDRKGSLTFTMAYNSIPIPGGKLNIYRIATVMELAGDLHYAWTPELADSGLQLSKYATAVFADRISMLVDSRSLPAASNTIDDHGKVSFTDLECGLYVVYQRTPAPGFEPIRAFCISIPMIEDGQFVYDIHGSPKPRPETTTTEITVTRVTVTTPHSEPTTVPGSTVPGVVSTTAPREEVTTVPHTERLTAPSKEETTTAPHSREETTAPPEKERLPQTGQLWWPAWVLGAAGIMLFGMGLSLRITTRQEDLWS